jgi:glycosyltransferase EpsD
LLAGTGNLSGYYQKQAGQLNVDAHVHFLGYHDGVHELLAISDIAMSSSRREGLPVNLMEAMATGLPIIATNCRGNRDLINNGYNGILVDGNNIQQMADAIQRLYLNKDLRIQFGKKNQSLIARYSTHTILKEMKRIYESAGLS